jgi:DNA-binding response OmpR family regulator
MALLRPNRSVYQTKGGLKLKNKMLLSIHPIKLVAVSGNTEIELSLAELKHLAYLIANRGRVVTTKELFEEIWKGRAMDHTNIVNVYVNYLRKKLGNGTIITVRGKGYRMAA